MSTLINVRWIDYKYIIATNSNTPLYIHSKSNHPPPISKQLPSTTNRRISSLTCNENEFNKAKPYYESSLKNSGFNYTMKFEVPVENTRRNRNRKIVWSNLPIVICPSNILSKEQDIMQRFVTVELKKAVLWMVNIYSNVWYTRHNH